MILQSHASGLISPPQIGTGERIHRVHSQESHPVADAPVPFAGASEDGPHYDASDTGTTDGRIAISHTGSRQRQRHAEATMRQQSNWRTAHASHNLLLTIHDRSMLRESSRCWSAISVLPTLRMSITHPRCIRLFIICVLLTACSESSSRAGESSDDLPNLTSDNIGDSQPPVDTIVPGDRWYRITAVDYRCGDNCYLEFRQSAAGPIESAICIVGVCQSWNDAGGMPETEKGRQYSAKFGTLPQVDGSGNVMDDTFLSVDDIHQESMDASSGRSSDGSPVEPADQDVPADAYGIFENSNNPTFFRVLLVEQDRLTLTTTVVLNGRKMPRPLTCNSSILENIEPSMRLALRCGDEELTFALDYRSSSKSWIVVEDGGTPEVYTRR